MELYNKKCYGSNLVFLASHGVRRGLVELKIIQEIWQKLGSGWVDQAPTWILYVFFVHLKKMDRGLEGVVWTINFILDYFYLDKTP